MVYAQNEYKAETIKHKFRAFIDTYHWFIMNMYL
jgi:hypothetical protein